MFSDLSERDIEKIGSFVPNWFIRAMLSGSDENILKTELKSNLEVSYEIAGRDLPDDSILQEKIDNLYDLYKETIADYVAGEE